MPASSNLIRQFHSGEPAAFGLLVSEHQDDVYTLCLRVIGDAERAEAAAETIFLTAHQAMHRLDPDTQLKQWITQLAVSHLESSNESLEPVDQAGTDQSATVNAMLGGLDMPFRLAVILRDVLGLSEAEVASILDLPLGTARSRIHRGRLTISRSLVGSLESV